MEREKCRGFCGQDLDFQVSTQKRSELLRGVHRIQQYEKDKILAKNQRELRALYYSDFKHFAQGLKVVSKFEILI